MAAINSTPRPAYVYDQSTNSWFPIAGIVNTSAAYTWTAAQDFSSPVTFTSTNFVAPSPSMTIIFESSSRTACSAL